ncbi:hypothetical protein CA13_23400 [Planctomycetes bacterium CA13]|uniref:Uncharacterized protein n=1 Tax=Novipirellula herctigrandis TaxID=2527986 RepID=A0A5C5Z0Q6_9BACT|nr:hypothetical protein CA13_23400 [Planctomycetes bacterium CA13]
MSHPDPPPSQPPQEGEPSKEGEHGSDQMTPETEATSSPIDGSPAEDETLGGAAIEDLERELNRLQRSIRLAIQSHLQKLAGRSFGSLEQNQQMAQSVHSLLDGHGLRVRCCECGHPAILRVSPRAGIEHGAFVFDHTIESRRTFHGGRSVMPELRLVAKPARKKPSAGKKAAG